MDMYAFVMVCKHILTKRVISSRKCCRVVLKSLKKMLKNLHESQFLEIGGACLKSTIAVFYPCPWLLKTEAFENLIMELESITYCALLVLILRRK